VLWLHREDILGIDFLVDISFGVCKSLFQSRTFIPFKILAYVHLHFPLVGYRLLFLVLLCFLPRLIRKGSALVVIFVHLDKNLEQVKDHFNVLFSAEVNPKFFVPLHLDLQRMAIQLTMSLVMDFDFQDILEPHLFSHLRVFDISELDFITVELELHLHFLTFVVLSHFKTKHLELKFWNLYIFWLVTGDLTQLLIFPFRCLITIRFVFFKDSVLFWGVTIFVVLVDLTNHLKHFQPHSSVFFCCTTQCICFASSHQLPFIHPIKLLLTNHFFKQLATEPNWVYFLNILRFPIGLI
jgi:hypothetical protein